MAAAVAVAVAVAVSVAVTVAVAVAGEGKDAVCPRATAALNGSQRYPRWDFFLFYIRFIHYVCSTYN